MANEGFLLKTDCEKGVTYCNSPERLIDEIDAQQILLAAEHRELELNLTHFSARDLLRSVVLARRNLKKRGYCNASD